MIKTIYKSNMHLQQIIKWKICQSFTIFFSTELNIAQILLSILLYIYLYGMFVYDK